MKMCWQSGLGKHQHQRPHHDHQHHHPLQNEGLSMLNISASTDVSIYIRLTDSENGKSLTQTSQAHYVPAPQTSDLKCQAGNQETCSGVLNRDHPNTLLSIRARPL